jgi:hypothetical protein
MQLNTRLCRILLIFALLPASLWLVGCDSETTTGPVAQPVPPAPQPPVSSSVFNIIVAANPDEFDINEGTSTAQITITARRNDNGQFVANGTTALLTTTFGTLSTSGGTGASVPIQFDAVGQAFATLQATATAPGTAIVRAQIESSFGSASITFADVEEDPFQISGISPTSGPPAGNTLLTISGTGFEAPIRVSFSVLGQTLILRNPVVHSPSRITASTPAIDLPSGQNAVASLTLQNAFGSTGAAVGTDTIPNAYVYTRGGGGVTTLKLFSISPTSGPNEGGTRVTILGEGFGPQMQVFFTNGPLVEATILNTSSTRLEVLTPAATGPNAANANSRVALRVVDSSTGASATLPAAYQYGADTPGLFISSISPDQDEYLGNRLVTIFGQGFDEPVAVSLGGLGQQIVSVTGTEIVVRTVRAQLACSDQSAPTSVTNIETNERISNGPAFTYRTIQPVVTGVSPNSGQQSGGNALTILGVARTIGRGFVSPVRVLINDQLATINGLSADATQIFVTAPPFTGTFETESCTVQPGGQTGTRNRNTSVSVQVINLDTGCEDTLEAGYAYIPADSTCRLDDAGGGGSNVAPVAIFTTTNIGGLLVRVVDSSTGTPTSWLWNFGDGSPVEAVQVPGVGGVHTYAAPGAYSINLTVTNANGSNSTSRNVTVP